MNRITKEKLLKLLFNPLVIAIPFALITILLVPVEFDEFSFETYSFEPADKHSKNTIQFYHNLDNDSIDEIISHFETDISQCAIKIIQNQQFYKGQWNFNGSLPKKARHPAYIDVNMDGILDVLVFYERNDSLFVGGVDMNVDSMKIADDIFIDKIKRVDGQTHYTAAFRIFDLNKDGRDDVIITVNAGYSEQPRRIYAWDIDADTIIKSPVVGFRHSVLAFVDIDDDGFPEVIPYTTSYENIEKGLGIPFNDYERWFVVYDHELNFKYGPINIGKGSGSVRCYILPEGGRPAVYLVDINHENNNVHHFYKFDIDAGKVVPVIDFFNMGNTSFNKLETADGAFYKSYDSNTGRFILIDADDPSRILADRLIAPGMALLSVIQLESYKDALLVFEDFQGKQNALRFFSVGNLEEIVHFSFSAERQFEHLSVYTNPKGKELVAVQLDEHIESIAFKTDPFYMLKLGLLYVFIYGFYILLIWLILRWQDKILKKHYQREQLIAELKLKSIRNQLDPHFTFNAVNAIASAIYKEEKEVAYDYFSRFSKLLRATTLYSDRMSRSLKDEIEFTMQYLDIELFRYREKFEYHFDVDDAINVSIEVPRMIIQTFAESAVTNGLMHRRETGRLDIRIRKEGNNLMITFDDNGVGIQESKRLNKDRAFKSVRIMDEFIRIFNELNGTKINYEMTDINPGDKYPGTRVIVKLPAILKYRGTSS